MIDAVLFDVGNTLLHGRVTKPAVMLELVSRSVYDRLVELELKLPPFEEYARLLKRRFGRAHLWSRISRREVSIVDVLRRVHSPMGVTMSAEQTGELCHKCISSIAELFTVDDSAKEAVTELHKAGVKLGLVSNTILPGSTIDDFLEGEGFLDFFAVRIYSSAVRYMKPSPKIYQLALDQLGVTADRTMFVGDRVDNDVVGPSSVGMRTVLYVPGDKLPREWDCADHTVRRLTEIPAIVSDLSA
jgi:putative hydrolase of the HAD superfamily